VSFVARRPIQDTILTPDRILPHFRVHHGKVVSRHTPTDDFILLSGASVIMWTHDQILSSNNDIFEQRSRERAVINRDGLLFFRGSAGVHACCVLNITSLGAGIRLDRLNIVPFDLGVSFDNFRTMRRCRLIWRDGYFIGAKLEV
jgi:hypothetical protein